MLYESLRLYFRFALAAFYREIQVEGLSHVPAAGPILLIGNHNNGLLDPIMVAAVLDRKVSFAAKSTLADTPLLGRLMRAVDVVFLHRQQDRQEGASIRSNLAALDSIVDRLGEGAAVCIFPEGKSHGEPALQRFKRGTAHVALRYLESDAPADELRVVPVGLVFEAKARRRSRARICFGAPIAVRAWQVEHPESGSRELIDHMQERVEALTLNFASRRDMQRLPALARVLAAEQAGRRRLGAAEPPPSQQAALVSRLIAGRARLEARDASGLAALEDRVNRHLDRLDALGIEAASLHRSRGRGAVLRFVLREGGLAILGLLPALWGALNWGLPFLTTRILARRLSPDEEQAATWAVFPAALIYPGLALVQSLAACWLLPAGWALAYVITLLPAGAFAQRYSDRLNTALSRGRDFLRLARHPRLRTELQLESLAIGKALKHWEIELQA